VVNQNGMVYDDTNIDRLLFERALGQEMRRSGGRSSKIKKRTKGNDEQFEIAFSRMIEENSK